MRDEWTQVKNDHGSHAWQLSASLWCHWHSEYGVTAAMLAFSCVISHLSAVGSSTTPRLPQSLPVQNTLHLMCVWQKKRFHSIGWHTLFNYMLNMDYKWKVHSKIIILSFTHLHFISNPYDLLSSVELKMRRLAQCSCCSHPKKVNGDWSCYIYSIYRY